MRKLRFKDQEWILVNIGDNPNEGAITTEELYEAFALNPYHLFEDGTIMQFGEIVGSIEDIEWLDD